MLLSEIRFSSLLCYSPRGDEAAHSRSRMWTWRLKDEAAIGTPAVPASSFFVSRLVAHVQAGALPDCFGDDVIVVPIPGHAPASPNGLWVPARLCDQMVAQGLAASSEHWLERVTAVEKSRTLVRPSALRHQDSMRVVPTEISGRRIVLVDDVITRGAVGLASASLLAARLPGSSITLFAVIRTISDPSTFLSMLAPCSGTVTLEQDGSTKRTP